MSDTDHEDFGTVVPEDQHPPSWHVERMSAIVRDLWRTNNIDLHMSDGTKKMGQSGLLHDIRESWRIIRGHLDLALDTVDMNHAACKTAESSVGAAILFERESCAKIAETEGVLHGAEYILEPEWYRHARRIASAIRSKAQ